MAWKLTQWFVALAVAALLMGLVLANAAHAQDAAPRIGPAVAIRG